MKNTFKMCLILKILEKITTYVNAMAKIFPDPPQFIH